MARIKEFYELRSVIVHGSTLESRKKLKKKFEKMDQVQFKKEMQEIENAIREFFKLQLLNENLRKPRREAEALLGKNLNLKTHPTL